MTDAKILLHELVCCNLAAQHVPGFREQSIGKSKNVSHLSFNLFIILQMSQNYNPELISEEETCIDTASLPSDWKTFSW